MALCGTIERPPPDPEPPIERTAVDPLPPTFAATREALRTVACYVIAPARKARTGRIALTPVPGGIGTLPFDDGSWIGVRGDHLVLEPAGREAPLTTLEAAADLVGVVLDPDPGVGHDLPTYEPSAPLAVDADASRVLADWYAYGAAVHAELSTRHGDRYAVSAPQLWPEHFDLAVAIDCHEGRGVNIGASAGDASEAAPYLYVGPWDRAVLNGDPFWNAPFGRTVGYETLRGTEAPVAAGADFVDEALRHLGFLD
jgi:hypothetical protein